MSGFTPVVLDGGTGIAASPLAVPSRTPWVAPDWTALGLSVTVRSYASITRSVMADWKLSASVGLVGCSLTMMRFVIYVVLALFIDVLVGDHREASRAPAAVVLPMFSEVHEALDFLIRRLYQECICKVSDQHPAAHSGNRFGRVDDCASAFLSLQIACY